MGVILLLPVDPGRAVYRDKRGHVSTVGVVYVIAFRVLSAHSYW